MASRTCGKFWILQKRHRYSTWRPMHWSGDFFVSTTMKAAVLPTNFEEVKNVFDMTQNMILEHEAEFLNVPPIDWTASSWTRSTLMHDQVDRKQKYTSTQIPSCVWGRCKSIQKRTKDGMLNRKNFNSPILRELFGIDGELIEFEWHISQDLPHWRSSKSSRKTCKIKTLNLNIMGDRSSSRDEERKFRKVNFELREEILARTLVIRRPRWWKEMVWNSRFHRHRDGGTFQRNWSPSFQGISAVSRGILKIKRWQTYHTLLCGFIEHRTLVSHNSLGKSAQYLRSSFELGVNSSLNGLRIDKSRLWTSSRQKKMSSYWKMWSRKKWTLRCQLPGATIWRLETDCENVSRDLQHWRKKSNLREFVMMPHSREESLLGWATKLLLT